MQNLLAATVFGLPLWEWLAIMMAVLYMMVGAHVIGMFDLWGDLWRWWKAAFKQAPGKVGGLLDSALLITAVPAAIIIGWASWLILLIVLCVILILTSARDEECYE